MKHCVKIILLFLLLVNGVAKAQFFDLDSISSNKFLRHDLNRLWVNDSNTLAEVFNKIWTFESQDSGKIRIAHIGDSHIQAGYFTGKVRECLHKGLGCGTRERGFIFPYGLAHTNGPMNYGAKYTGAWRGYKSSSNLQVAPWGLSGITASTQDDSASLKIYTNNKTFDSYRFNKVRLYFIDSAEAFEINFKAAGEGDNTFCREDEQLCYREYIIPGGADTAYFEFLKDSSKTNAALLIQGVELINDSAAGITYSEIGVNGASTKSYLKCDDFTGQLLILAPDLVVFSLGTNDAYNLSFSDSLFEQYYDSLITQTKANLPTANIILTTPGDAKRFRKTVLKENLAVRRVILKLAKKHDCAVWDFFNIMGGLGAINNWYAANLTAADFLHLNEAGYALQGELFYTAFAKAYNDFTQIRRTKPLIINEGVDVKQLLFNVFTYQKNDPVFFNHYLFWLFFSVFFVFYAFVTKNFKARSFYVFIISLFFYYKAGGFYFSLLILSTLLDFFIGNKIFKAKAVSRKKWWLVGSVIANLLLLFFFKYTNFFVELTNDVLGTSFQSYNVFAGLGNLIWDRHFDVAQIALPVGISFYTFQTISYSVDIYRGRIQPVKSIWDFGFFVSFFPQLVAGPIVRASEFIHQIYQPYKLTYANFSRAGLLIVGGLFKKMVISDYLSVNYVDRVFESPLKYSGFENLLGAYGYSIQIYCDFSAYSDIAIGLALLLGFSLPQNFNAPYLSTNITDFWRRWHMSLSRWLKDYLYIPLGGNRKGKVRTQINLFLTMVIGGLWHGAAIKFIVWGALHGAGLAVHKLFLTVFPVLGSSNRFLRFFTWLVTFHFIVFCWVFFRAENWESVGYFFNQLTMNFHASEIFTIVSQPEYLKIIGVIILGFLLHLMPDAFEIKIQSIFANKFWPAFGIVAVIMVVLVYQFKSANVQPFIYFSF